MRSELSSFRASGHRHIKTSSIPWGWPCSRGRIAKAPEDGEHAVKHHTTASPRGKHHRQSMTMTSASYLSVWSRRVDFHIKLGRCH